MESENSKIEFSPRRLAVSYYCGALGKHLRNRNGIPRNPGLEHGSDVDRVIELFYTKGIYVPGYPELDYVISFAPPRKGVQAAKTTTVTREVNGKTYTVSGKSDLDFPDMGVEIKTGKAKAWHHIQALTYAISEGKPFKVMYVSTQYSDTIEPDEESFAKILERAWENELSEHREKNEHCSQCPIRVRCPVWQHDHGLARVVASMKDVLESDVLTESQRGYFEKMYNYTRFLARQHLEVDKGYHTGDYTITPYHGVKGKERDESKIEKKHETGIPDPKKIPPSDDGPEDYKPVQIAVTKKVT